MRLVRCDQCGEVADLAKIRTCMGCDHPLPEAPGARPPGRVPPAQREAWSDLSTSKAILNGLVVGGVISLIFIFLKEVKSAAVAAPLGIVLAVLVQRVRKRKEERQAPADISAPPSPPPAPRTSPSRWTCAKCGTVVEPQFDACWQCAEPRSLAERSRTVIPARVQSPQGPVRFSSTRPVDEPESAIANGCRIVLTVLGGVVALIVGGIVLLYITCANSSFL